MIYRRGAKGIWSYRFRFGGRMIHESTKTTSKTLARDAERHRRRELEEKWNRIEKRSLPPTLKAASQRWLEKRTALAASTRGTYEAALKHLRTGFGSELICEIESRDVVEYQNARLAHGAAGATINKEIACLSSILGVYGIWEQLRRDVKGLTENEPGRALSRDEEKWLLEHAQRVGLHQGSWTPLYAVTALALNTGMRHKEIRTLKWKDLDLKNRLLRVAESKTEAGRGRPIPLTQPAWAALDIWASRFPIRNPEHFVFPACENGRINRERPIANWRSAWRNATTVIHCPTCGQAQNPGMICAGNGCKGNIQGIKSPVAGLRFHDLRHNAATKLLEQGTPFPIVAQILGWAASTAVRMAKRYGHIRPEVQRRALESITTAEPVPDVHQIVHQARSGILSERTN